MLNSSHFDHANTHIISSATNLKQMNENEEKKAKQNKMPYNARNMSP